MMSREEEENMCRCFGTMGINMDDSEETKRPSSSSCSSSNVSSPKPQQRRSYANCYPNRDYADAKFRPVVGPLYSGDIWRDINYSDAGQHMSSNNLNGSGFTSNDWNNSPRLHAWAGSQSHDGLPDWNAMHYANYLPPRRPLMCNDMPNLSIFGNDSMLPSNVIAPTTNMTQSALHELAKKPQATFDDVYNYLFETMNDSKGRHVFEELLLSCNDEQLRIIVSKIATHPRSVFNISVCSDGSKSMKKLIKVLEKKTPLIHFVVTALYSIFPQLMTNRNGCSVIKECLNILDSQQTEILYEAFRTNWFKLAQDEKGCIYLNEFIDSSKGQNRDSLLGLISAESKFLSQDPSGNFVLQHVLGLQHPIFSEIICEELRDLYIQLSRQKAGSHVVEKCLKSPGMSHVVNVLLKTDKLGQVGRDQYGNFVIQTALKETKKKGEQVLHEALLIKILQNRNEMERGYGANVFTLVKKDIPDN